MDMAVAVWGDGMNQAGISERVLISSVFPDPANVRKHDDKNIKAIEASLKRFGQQKPIVIDQENIVRAGNGTLQAAINLGWKEIWVHKSDLADAEMIAYAIADNRTSETSDWDLEALEDQLKALPDDLAEIAFDEFKYSKEPKPPGDGLANLDDDKEYLIVINCKDESHQEELFDEFSERGIECKLM